MVVDPFCSVVSGFVGDPVIAPVSTSCVRGVHVAGMPRTPGGAGLTSPSAEADVRSQQLQADTGPVADGGLGRCPFRASVYGVA
jgi:hypothetical protein